MVHEGDQEQIRDLLERHEIGADLERSLTGVRITVFAGDPAQIGRFVSDLTRLYALEIGAEGVDGGEDPIENVTGLTIIAR